jgi:hypothetical protein
MSVSTTSHAPTVVIVRGSNHGYPFRAECGCGWQSRGYAAAHAAQIMADDHAAAG